MKKTAIALLAWFVSSASLAATPWQKITHPVPGAAQSIGSFANGCIIGADTLPVQSDNYQVMRTDQRRYFGHPDLVMFIQRLSHQAQQRGLGTVLIGDMGMPAGGALMADTPVIRPGLMWIFSCSCRKRAGARRSYCARRR